MRFTSWLRSLKSLVGRVQSTTTERRRCPVIRRQHLLLEVLEDRLAPALLTVTNGGDTGANTLRAALAAANSGDVIDFAATVRTIDLTSAGLNIATNVTIQNDQGVGPVTIDGDNQFTVFTVINSGLTAVLSGLTIQHGLADGGGGIYNSGTLTVSNSTLSDNTAGEVGGGIYNSGTLTVSNSTLSDNTAGLFDGGGGGGILNAGTLTVSNSTLADNSAGAGGVGGGIANVSALSATLKNTIVAESTSGGDLYTVIDPGYGEFSGSNDLIGDGSYLSSLTNSIQGNPLLAPLGNYGGPTQTMALLPGSPAIGTGQTEPGATDQRGALRSNSGPSDIGAFQTEGYSLTAGSTSTPQSTVVNTAFDNSLLVTLTENFADDPLPGATVSFVAGTGAAGPLPRSAAPL